MKKIVPFFISLLVSLSTFAQGESSSAGLMRSHLKIYVVVAVLLVIFSGISLFLLSLDRRVKKLEEK
jgi:CcmD family protein